MPLEKDHRNQWPHTSTHHCDTKSSCYSEPVHSYIFNLPATIQTLQLFALSPRIYSVRGSWGRWESTLLSVQPVCTMCGPPRSPRESSLSAPHTPHSRPSSQTEPSTCPAHHCLWHWQGWLVAAEHWALDSASLQCNSTAPSSFQYWDVNEMPFKNERLLFCKEKKKGVWRSLVQWEEYGLAHWVPRWVAY